MFRLFYLFIIIFYTWYRTILLFISQTRKKKEYPPFKGKVSIIIPSYNEKKYILVSLIHSVIAATKDLNAEIIIGDDGSKIRVVDALKDLDKKILSKIKILTLPHRGKRETQQDCINAATGEVIVTLDSDVLMENQAIYELLKPFNDPKIGAVTGNIKILNENQNWLTRATATMYWNAFNVARHSLSGFGIVNVCSGALSAYRKEIVDKVMPQYINQYFLGNKCVHGDDRALTNLVLKEGYKILFCDKAICYTVSPEKLKGFIKQQYRWRQSMIRESWIAIRFSISRNFLLFLENLFLLLLPLMNVVIIVSLITSLIKYPFIAMLILHGMVITTIIHNLFLILESPKQLKYAFIYTVLAYTILIWLWPIALLNIRKSKWGTR